jgi:hypothetical protein
VYKIWLWYRGLWSDDISLEVQVTNDFLCYISGRASFTRVSYDFAEDAREFREKEKYIFPPSSLRRRRGEQSLIDEIARAASEPGEKRKLN